MMRYLTLIPTLISGAILLVLVLFLGYFSLPLLRTEAIGELLGGADVSLLAMLTASLVLSVTATLLATLFALAVALSLESMPSSRLKVLMLGFVNLLTAIPTVVYGFVGVVVLIPFMRDVTGGSGYSLLTAALVLSLVVTPTIILFFNDSFRSVPKTYKSIVYALGGNSEHYQLKVLLRAASRGLSVGVMMGFARAIGDTMIALMLSGNALVMPDSLSGSARVLTAHIALLFAGDFDSLEFRSIFASGLLLFLLSTIVVMLMRRMRVRHA